MDKKHRTTKYSLRKPSTMVHDKSKKLRTITGRSPKGIQITAQQKFSQLNKFKRLPLGSQREIFQSALPLDSPLASRGNEAQQLKLYHSNVSYGDLPLSLSEKTIKFTKPNEKKVGNKLTKTKKKAKAGREEKKSEEQKTQGKCLQTMRKVTQTKDDYEILYKKTEKILQQYKQRQMEWQQEKTTLMQQLEDIRRKSMGMALTSCSSYSLNRRNFF